MRLLGDEWNESCDRSVYFQAKPTFELEVLINLTFRQKLLLFHPICLGSLSKLLLSQSDPLGYLQLYSTINNDHNGIDNTSRRYVEQKLWHVGLPWHQIDFWGGTVDEVDFQMETHFASSYLVQFSTLATNLAKRSFRIPPNEHHNYHWSSWYRWDSWVMSGSKVVIGRSTLRQNRLFEVELVKKLTFR